MDLKKRNILLIEDNEGDSFYIQEILTESSTEDFEVDWKNSLESGLNALKKNRYDLIITDLTLPGFKGLETFENILEHAPTDMPILILTGLNDQKTGLKAVSMGAQDYLIKDNLESRSLRKAISYAIERKKAYTTIEKQKKEIENAYKKLQDQQMQLIQSEKMSTIGTMVAGIAHELNNPMMGIINCIQFCLDSHSPDSKEAEYLQLAEEATDRCIKIIKNLLTFSHSDDEKGFSEENIVNLLEEVLMLTNYMLNTKQIKVDRDYPEDPPVLLLKANNIKQVFLNLLTNAIDSLEEGDDRKILITVSERDDNIKIGIQDNGKGIPEEALGRIFDPFFTTKTVGKGTGLGLSICRNIMRDHHGDITVCNRPDGGVISEIIFPARNGNTLELKEAMP